MKKIIAFVLAASMLLCLCACSAETRIQDYESEVEKPVVVTPEPTAEPVEQEEIVPLDWAGAFAKHEPDEVVFTVDGTPVTWQEFFYELAGCTTSLQISANALVTNWDAQLQDGAGNTISVGTYILQNVLSILCQYKTVYDHLVDQGVTLTDADYALIEQDKQAVADANFDGDREKFLTYLQSLFCTEEVFDWFSQADRLYYNGFDVLYGVGGRNFSDADTLSYGVNYGYVQLKQLYLAAPAAQTADASAEPETEATAEPVVDMQILLDALAACRTDAEKAAKFDELYAEYNQNPDLDVYGAERAVYPGDLPDGVYSAAAALAEYGYGSAKDGGADVLVMRLPLKADTPVFLDPVTGEMHDLRFYAAWQAYSDLITGPEGWISTAVIEFSENFRNFSLNELFGLTAPASDEPASGEME